VESLGAKRFPEADSLGDVSTGPTLTTQSEDALDECWRGPSRAAVRSRGTIVQTGDSLAAMARQPLVDGSQRDATARRGGPYGWLSNDDGLDIDALGNWAGSTVPSRVSVDVKLSIAQNIQQFRWKKDRVNQELTDTMCESYSAVRGIAKDRAIDMQTAAFTLALRRVVEAGTARMFTEEEFQI
jgi:hypothetical protein